MVRALPEPLLSRARRAGLLPRYRSLDKEVRALLPETARALLCELTGAGRGADRRARTGRAPSGRSPAAESAAVAPPVLLSLSRSERRALGVRAPGTAARLYVREEGSPTWRRLNRLPGGRRFVLPRDLGPGCHSLSADPEGAGLPQLVVAGPPRLRAHGPRRRWGLFVPVYALRDRGTWGCGDLSAFERLGGWAARAGASVLATLPLLPTFLDRPFDPSPYRPVSRRFWNEIYLDPRATPEFARSGAARELVRERSFREQVALLEERSHVDFRVVARLKRSVLEAMRSDFPRSASAARRGAFAAFVRSTPDLEEYARFRAFAERGGEGAAEYHRFAQWLVDEQFRAVARRLQGIGVDLYLDLPIGVHPRGFDVAHAPDTFARGVSLGSPPDPGVPEGQDWGLPPWRPAALVRSGYRPWIEPLAHHFTVARFLRVDHALGLHRQFWIPTGRPASEGAYVRFPARELYATLVAEAARFGAEVVGEDLGTTPPELRSTLRRRGILRLYVAQLEWDGLRPRHRVPADSVASLNTHDFPPFAAYWDRLGEPGRAAAPAAAAFRTATARLARSPARLLLVNLEDLWGEMAPQNVPGKGGPRQFSRRCAVDLPTILRRADWSEWLCALDALRRA